LHAVGVVDVCTAERNFGRFRRLCAAAVCNTDLTDERGNPAIAK